MNISPKKRPAHRIFKALAVLAMSGILGVGALLGLLWLERRSEITLPTPTGPFAVGRGIYVWADEGHSDPLAPVPGTKRELLVWIWYPAAAGQSAAVVDDYVPAQVRAPAGRVGGSLIFRFLTRDLSKVHGHSTRDSDLSPQQRTYPVAIMRAGASAPVMNYSTLAEDLASHGYVVVGFDAPYRTSEVVFPDGRVIERRPENNPELFSGEELIHLANKLLAAWTGDIAYVLDRLERLNGSDASGKFAGRLDMTRVGVFGHSFGGATAAQFCSQDSRCKAGIDVDGSLHGSVIQAGIHKPFMFLLSDHGDFSSDAESRQIMADIQSIYDRLPPDERLLIAIRGANHFTFSDDGAVLKSRLVRGLLRVFGKLGIDGRRQLAVTAYCVRSFFDAYLKGPGVSKLRISSPLYPEIQVLE
jgi:dienelactone hydrolase